MKRIISLSIISSIFFCCLMQSVFAQYERLNIVQYKLNNGLTVILNPDANQKSVFGGVAVKAGSKNDPKELTGIAHYLEHMLFKGTDEMGSSDYKTEKVYLDSINALYDKLAQTKDEVARKAIRNKINNVSQEAGKYAIPTEFDKLVRSIGGSGLNAFTSNEMTFFFNAFPSNQVEKWLDLYSQRFLNPVFRLFQSELEVVYEEKNMYNDNFITSLFELFMKNLYKNHPYGQQTAIGTTEHLKNPSLTKMYNFFKTYYVANNMVLVLTGNFNVDEVKPMIEEKFGRLRRGDVPEFPKYDEKPFKGREFIEANLSPVKIGVLGFRTVPNNDKDEVALDVCDKILSNTGETGLLNKLVLDNKIMFAGTLPMGRNNDYGSGLILFIPKIIGQPFSKAEALVLKELENLRNGLFSDQLLEACKNELYVDFVSKLEDPQMRTVYLAQAFTQNTPIDDFLNYPKKIKGITKEDVIRVANAYYNKNYLALHSKMGFPKKEKLEKPGYDPVKPNENAVSPYAESFYKMKDKEAIPNFVSFTQDFATIKLNDKVIFYHTQNPYDDIYSLNIKIGTGSFENINLPYAAQIMNYAGTSTKTIEQVKAEFQIIGTSYAFSCDESYIYIELKGIEENFIKAMGMLNELLKDPQVAKEKINLIVDEEKTSRKMEGKEPADVGSALQQYIRKGDNSEFLKRLPLKAIGKLKTDQLVKEFKAAMVYATEFHYCGKIYDPEKAMTIIKENFIFPADMKASNSPVQINDKEIKENTVYFVNDKKALQSQIYFIANGNTFDIDKAANYDAFNEYFGGGFSGLVVQEIREYRSMAYSTGAKLVAPPLANRKNAFVGFIGTQADKTNEALEVFMGLFREMPIKTERLDVLKASLIQEAYASRPNFRSLSQTVVEWQQEGFKEDPAKYKIAQFKNMTFDKIVNLYNTELKSKPVAICIVGDKSRLNMKDIAKYGKIVFIDKKVLYRK